MSAARSRYVAPHGRASSGIFSGVGMTTRLLLHIGTMKSATSFLQIALRRNQERLLAAGILYPVTDQFEAVSDLLARRPSGTPLGDAGRALRRELKEHQGMAIMSNEMLAAKEVGAARRLLGALPVDEVHVVLTARDLARVIPSAWQTTLRSGGKTEWTSFAASVCAGDAGSDLTGRLEGGVRSATVAVEAPLVDPELHARFWACHDLAAILDRWQQVVPRERITLVTVPGRAAPPALLATRFGSLLGLELDISQMSPRINPSLGAHSAELLRRLNERAVDPERLEVRLGVRTVLGRSFAEASRDEPGFGLSADLLDWTVKRAQQVTNDIERSGVRVVGDLEDLVPTLEEAAASQLCSPSGTRIDPAASADSDLVDAALRGLAVVVRTSTADRASLHDLRVERARLEALAEQQESRIAVQQRRLEAQSAKLSAQGGRLVEQRQRLADQRRRITGLVAERDYRARRTLRGRLGRLARAVTQRRVTAALRSSIFR